MASKLGRISKLGVKDKQRPLGVQIHHDLDEWIREKDDRSTWLREAIIAFAWQEVGGRKKILDSINKEPGIWLFIGESHRLPPELVQLIVEKASLASSETDLEESE